MNAAILIGGPNKGTRFRPLSFKVPKPLFPIAGKPIIQYHIKACAAVDGLKNVYLIGSYQTQDRQLLQFLCATRREFPDISIHYLQEYTHLGTAGALFHFRDLLQSPSKKLFVLNGDILCDFPLHSMYTTYKSLPFQSSTDSQSFPSLMLTTEIDTPKHTLGCLVVDEKTGQIRHFVEKPEDFLATHINCGVYLMNTDQLFGIIQEKRDDHYDRQNEIGAGDYLASPFITLERDVFPQMVAAGSFYSHCLETRPGAMHWAQIKSATSALNANRLMLAALPGQCHINSGASISNEASIGPNVSIGDRCQIGAGVRIRDSIILDGCRIKSGSCIVNSIIGWDSSIGEWSHVEGVVSKIDPDQKHPILETEQNCYFHEDGTLKQIVTILGHNVTIQDEMAVYSSLILPGKTISVSIRNQIIL